MPLRPRPEQVCMSSPLLCLCNTPGQRSQCMAGMTAVLETESLLALHRSCHTSLRAGFTLWPAPTWGFLEVGVPRCWRQRGGVDILSRRICAPGCRVSLCMLHWQFGWDILHICGNLSACLTWKLAFRLPGLVSWYESYLQGPAIRRGDSSNSRLAHDPGKQPQGAVEARLPTAACCHPVFVAQVWGVCSPSSFWAYS